MDKLTKVTTRLFSQDVRILKTRQKREGVSWQVLLRNLIHAHTSAPLKAFKFWIPGNEERSLPDDLRTLDQKAMNITVTYRGCLAVATGTSEEQARALLHRVAAEEGVPMPWLAIATVTELDLSQACRLCRAEV